LKAERKYEIISNDQNTKFKTIVKVLRIRTSIFGFLNCKEAF